MPSPLVQQDKFCNPLMPEFQLVLTREEEQIVLLARLLLLSRQMELSHVELLPRPWPEDPALLVRQLWPYRPLEQ
jgi:hypothetical protein